MKTAVLAVLITIFGPGGLGAQEQILVGGAGSMIPVMQEVATAYQSRNASDRIEVVPNSLGTGGSLKAAQAGRLAIGLTARPPRPAEKGLLTYRSLGLMPVVFAVNSSVGVSDLSEAQLCGIFSGRIRSWKDVGGADTPIIPLGRTGDDGDTLALRTHLACYKDLKEGPEVVTFAKANEMTAALATRPGTIGLTTLSAVLKAQGRFKAVAIGGVAATPDTVRTGRYRLAKECGLVTVGEPDGATKRFIDFVAGPEGQKMLTQNGLIARAGSAK